jgi:type II secretory pathway pseudopilin PulG
VTRPLSNARARFTLLELIVVMVLLVVLAAITAPRLSDFFRGRRLDSEARRLWALSQRARSESLALGLPVVVWADSDTGRYGLAAGPGLGSALTPSTYTLATDLQIDAPSDLSWYPDGSIAVDNAATWRLYDIRYPDSVWLLEADSLTGYCRLVREVSP